MSFLSKFFRSREKILTSPEPFRAFAPDPSKNYWQLAGKGDNQAAIEQLKRGSFSLVHVASGVTKTLPEVSPTLLLFVTPWDTYSATTLGALKKRVDAGAVASFAVVFFEASRESIKEAKARSWYFSSTYVLSPNDSALGSLVGRVPIQVTTDSGGAVLSVMEDWCLTRRLQPTAEKRGG